MKYLKTYEETINNPKPGDYIITNVVDYTPDANNYLNSLVYKVNKYVISDSESLYNVSIELDKLNPNYYNYFNKYKKFNKAVRYFRTKEIKNIFKTQKEAELTLATYKYNL